MSRTTARNSLANLLTTLVDGEDQLIFKSVYPVKPIRVDKRFFPTAIVMLPRNVDERRGPSHKTPTYSFEIRIFYSAPSVDWQQPGEGHNLFTPPADEPQVLFDQWLEALVILLRANKSFPQDVPPIGATISLGDDNKNPIKTTLGEPERDGNNVVCSAVVELIAREVVFNV